MLMQLFIAGVFAGGIYCTVGYGFVLNNRVSKKFNLAQSSCGMMGIMITRTLWLGGWSLNLALLVGIAIAFIGGLLVERIAVNPLRASKIIGWLLSTLAVNIMLAESASWVWGSEILPFPPLLGETWVISFAGGTVRSDMLLTIIVTITLILLLELLCDKTMWGRAIKATAVDRGAAELVGIHTTLLIMLTYGITSAMSAVAIALAGPTTNISTNIGTELLMKGFCVAALAGLESRRSIILAGILFGCLESFGSYITPSGYREVFAFSVLLLILILKPHGLFTKRVVIREL